MEMKEKSMRKRNAISAVVLSIGLVFGLTACGEEDDDCEDASTSEFAPMAMAKPNPPKPAPPKANNNKVPAAPPAAVPDSVEKSKPKKSKKPKAPKIDIDDCD